MSPIHALQPTRVALLTNIVAPYRVPVYQGLGKTFQLGIFLSGAEDNRSTWTDVERDLEGVTLKQSWGFTLRIPQRREGKVFDQKYLHITPGFLWDLVHFRPNAVITTEMGFRTLIALLYGTLWRRPVWIWWGGTRHTERNTGMFKRTLRFVVSKWASRWISYGDTSSDYLMSLGVKRRDILQIQNCVDETIYTRRVMPTLRVEPKPTFLYVGQFISRKGVVQLLYAASQLQKEGYRFSLLLVGGGPEKERLVQLAEELRLQDVHWMSALPPAEMPAIYRSADFLVFPTLEDVWGLVVNEALWSGLPVLCSKYAGCATELLPHENVFDPLDVTQFATVWRRALEGQVKPAETKVLKSASQVAAIIVGDISGSMAFSSTGDAPHRNGKT